ncbi:MAG: hypothetical protein KDK36_18330 [Leptospiraceae bacterium]|nr:hypothetical protein [Leptospiraceae bacterium]
MTTLELCYISSGIFFIVGLISGIWKYIGIIQSEKAEAREYINILHRTSLMYSFATLLLAKFVELNPYSERVKFYSVLVMVTFFSFAQITYLLHALLKDTDNQFLKPYKLGKIHLPPFMIHLSMILLIIGEIGGFSILFWGYIEKVLF